MYKPALLTIVTTLLTSQIICQSVSDSLENQCIEISKLLVQENVFDTEKFALPFYGVSQSYIGNSECFLLGPDSYHSFTVDKDTINLWPEKKLFFDRVHTWARLCSCEYTGTRTTIQYEIIQKDSIRQEGIAKLSYSSGAWQLKKNRAQEVSPPKHAFDPKE